MEIIPIMRLGEFKCIILSQMPWLFVVVDKKILMLIIPVTNS